jgi:hypothetical protein
MAQRMSGGARLVGRGDPEPCHGLVRFGWAALRVVAVVLATGTNVAGTDLDGALPVADRVLGPAPGTSRTATGTLTGRMGREGRFPRSSPG